MNRKWVRKKQAKVHTSTTPPHLRTCPGCTTLFDSGNKMNDHRRAADSASLCFDQRLPRVRKRRRGGGKRKRPGNIDALVAQAEKTVAATAAAAAAVALVAAAQSSPSPPTESTKNSAAASEPRTTRPEG